MKRFFAKMKKVKRRKRETLAGREDVDVPGIYEVYDDDDDGFLEEVDERVFMKPGERMDVLNDVFYDEESWQEEQERYQELSEEEREMRRYEISRLSRWSTFMEVRGVFSSWDTLDTNSCRDSSSRRI